MVGKIVSHCEKELGMINFETTVRTLDALVRDQNYGLEYVLQEIKNLYPQILLIGGTEPVCPTSGSYFVHMRKLVGVVLKAGNWADVTLQQIMQNAGTVEGLIEKYPDLQDPRLYRVDQVLKSLPKIVRATDDHIANQQLKVMSLKCAYTGLSLKPWEAYQLSLGFIRNYGRAGVDFTSPQDLMEYPVFSEEVYAVLSSIRIQGEEHAQGIWKNILLGRATGTPDTWPAPVGLSMSEDDPFAMYPLSDQLVQVVRNVNQPHIIPPELQGAFAKAFKVCPYGHTSKPYALTMENAMVLRVQPSGSISAELMARFPHLDGVQSLEEINGGPIESVEDFHRVARMSAVSSRKVNDEDAFGMFHPYQSALKFWKEHCQLNPMQAALRKRLFEVKPLRRSAQPVSTGRTSAEIAELVDQRDAQVQQFFNVGSLTELSTYGYQAEQDLRLLSDQEALPWDVETVAREDLSKLLTSSPSEFVCPQVMESIVANARETVQDLDNVEAEPLSYGDVAKQFRS